MEDIFKSCKIKKIPYWATISNRNQRVNSITESTKIQEINKDRQALLGIIEHKKFSPTSKL